MTTKTWNLTTVTQLYEQPLLVLIYEAQRAHQSNFHPNDIELCTLLSIKTGNCPEDCAYCPQSGHYKTDIQREKLLDIETIVQHARVAHARGAQRFCMGAAWRSLPNKHFSQIIEIIKAVKALGLEVCVTLGMLTLAQAKALKTAGLDFYNHNLDTSPEYYKKIITTRTYQERLETLGFVRQAGINICCGGIIGMGESRQDRIGFLLQLVNLIPHPESVPINQYTPITGTPLADKAGIDTFEFVRTIAAARILMPTSKIRLSAGRELMSDEMQLLCFMAGVNSIFLGNKLLTTPNPDYDEDQALLARMNISGMNSHATHQAKN